MRVLTYNILIQKYLKRYCDNSVIVTLLPLPNNVTISDCNCTINIFCSPRNVMKWHHVSPEEAVRIHTDLRCSGSLAIHWGTFKGSCPCFPLLSFLLNRADRKSQVRQCLGFSWSWLPKSALLKHCLTWDFLSNEFKQLKSLFAIVAICCLSKRASLEQFGH